MVVFCNNKINNEHKRIKKEGEMRRYGRERERGE